MLPWPGMANTFSTPSRIRMSTTIWPPVSFFVVMALLSWVGGRGLTGHRLQGRGWWRLQAAISRCHAECVRGDRQSRVHHRQRGEERGVDDEEVVDVVGAAVWRPGPTWTGRRRPARCLPGAS